MATTDQTSTCTAWAVLEGETCLFSMDLPHSFSFVPCVFAPRLPIVFLRVARFGERAFARVELLCLLQIRSEQSCFV